MKTRILCLALLLLASQAFAQPAEKSRYAATISKNWGNQLSPEELRNRETTLRIMDKSGLLAKDGSLSPAALATANALYEKFDFNFANQATCDYLVDAGYLMIDANGNLLPACNEKLQTFAQYNYAIYATKKINQGWQNYMEQYKAGKVGYNEWLELRENCMKDRNFTLNSLSGIEDTTIDGKRHVLMVSWKKQDFIDSYIKTANGVKTHTSYNKFFEYPLFLTTAAEVRTAAGAYNMWNLTEEQMNTRMMQILGLPPTSTNTQFVEFWVKEEDLFRPMIDSLIQQSYSPFKANPAYYQALSNYMTGSYKDDKLFSEFPFLGLGYTYDWNPENKTHTGVSEFVLKENRVARVRSITPTREYISQHSPQTQRMSRAASAEREGGR